MDLSVYRNQLMDSASRQPDELRGQLEAFGESGLHTELEPGGWTAHQVLAHVRDVEEQAFWPRIKRILEEDTPVLENFDESAWMEEHYDPSELVEAILEAFEGLRASGLELLRSLEPESWNRPSYHPARGEKTLQWWCEYAIAHVEEHLVQLQAGQS